MVLHCGDLTKESKPTEYRRAIQQLMAIEAPLKIVIHGPNDITLDECTYLGLMENPESHGPEYDIRRMQRRVEFDEVLRMFRAAAEDGITLFHKRGTHRIALPNGGLLSIHVRPYSRPVGAYAGLNYEPATVFDYAVGPDTDIIMSSHPPMGILDRGRDGTLEGCPNLFRAVSLDKPKLHLFGHVHENWGARVVKWRDINTMDRAGHALERHQQEGVVHGRTGARFQD